MFPEQLPTNTTVFWVNSQGHV